ncbi:MAG: hypothetical protein KDD47_18345, partial [Acidobacteria bacterium]|nr:hypothetical protein [Acidobacteriota bacterium]
AYFDSPKYAVWPDAYLVTANQGDLPPVYALDRENMLSPDGATCPTARPMQKIQGADGLPALSVEALTPADLDGRLPPVPSPAFLLRHRDEELNGDLDQDPLTDQLEVWSLIVDFADAAQTTMVQLADVTISDFDSNLCPPIEIFSCIPQPGGAPALDPMLEVVMNRLTYRYFGSHETLVGVLQTDVNDSPDHSGERWFELRRTPAGSGDWTLFQEGTYSPDGDGRFMGTVAMDGGGNMLLAYNVSSTTVFPSLRYTGRQVGDPLGVMTVAETTLAAGSAANSSNLYGSYNQMGVDPVDECTFWFLGMYNPSGKGVRIGAVRFDLCNVSMFADGFESGDVSAWSASLP